MVMRGCALALLLPLVAASAACHDPDKYQLLSPSNPGGTAPSEVLDVVPQSTSIPANGGSRTRIEARINPSSTVRTVSFATTQGTLFAGGDQTSSTTTAIDVPIGTNGVAVAELQSTTQPGTARVTAKIAIPKTNPTQFFTQSVDITFSPVNVGEMIALSASPSSADADGFSLITLVATISPSLPLGSRVVKFETTDGKFVTGNVENNGKRTTVTADAGHTAAVDFIAPLFAGPVTITASVSDTFTARTTITFGPALPDRVFVQLNKGSVALVDETAEVTVTLLRDNRGQVADNTVVTYSAVDSTGKPIGSFGRITLATVQSGNGDGPKPVKATAEFDPDDTAATGVATITATAGGRSGTATITLK